MGATLSYLGYASNQQRYTRSHGDTASPSIIDLYTRLITLEKDLQVSQAGNTHKEIVIQYLLQSNASNYCLRENVQLQTQLLVLKTNINRTKRENEEIKDKLRKAEEAVALFTSSVPTSSTSFSSYTNSPLKSEAVTGDLIDLLGCSQEPDSAKLIEDDSTLLDELHEDEPDIEEFARQNRPDRALHQYPDLVFEGSSYLVHFADSDGDAKLQDTAVLSAKVQGSRDLSNSTITSRQQDNALGLSEKSDDSSSKNASSPCGAGSTATSFSTTSSGVSPSDDVHSKLLNEGFSQLEALDSEGGNLDKSTAIVSTLADNLSDFDTRLQAEPSGPTLQALGEAQDPQASIGGNSTEPRWRPGKSFDPAKYRGNAVRIDNRGAQTGAKAVSYPDFFKYGIRYVPKVYDQDAYRTVVISGLPSSITMKALLEKVRGGMIVDAKLLDTEKITGSNTALVTFLYELSAMAYEDHAREHPIVFNNAPARIAVVPTPTWPMSFSLRSAIELEHTRCFEVHNLPRDVSLPAVRQELKPSPVMKTDSLQCMRLGADGVLGLRFSSIRAATQSYALFTKTLRYRRCTVKWIPDPCAQPLETLLEIRTDTSEDVEEDTSEPSCSPGGKASADGNLGRLAKVDWNIKAECRRGRGFLEDQTDTTTHALCDPADHSTSPSSVSTGEPIRKETSASIASFAKAFFPLE